jgi:branched-chain amino acid transport system substrate-binding protein
MRRTSIAVLGCALSLTVAACGGSAPAGTTDGGGDSGPIKVGSLHPISGDLAADGQQMDNGAKLAVEAINQAGGIKSLDGRKLQLLSGDTQGEPDIGQSEAERLIQEGAVGLVGTYQSDVSANVSAVAERNEVPFVIDVSSDDAILQQGYKYTFRVQPSSSVMGTEGAKYLREISSAAGEPAKKIAILHEYGPFGTAVSESFTAEAKRQGMQVGPVISYDPLSVTDLTTQMTKVKAAGADVLVVTGYYSDSVLAADAVKAVKPQLDAVFGVADGAYDLPQFPAQMGSASEGYYDSNYHSDMTNPEMQKLAALYQKRFGEEIRTGAVLAYDSVRVIASSLEAAGDTEPSAVRDAIAQGSFETLIASNGPISFTDTGENENAVPILMQVQDGKIVQAHPDEFAQAKPMYPAPPAQ